MSGVEIEISDDRWFRGEWDFRPQDKPFDRTCDQVRDLFQSYCNPAYIREETVTVPKTIRYVQREEEIV